jgi:uncharacterized protein (TIGR02266 family)
MDERNRRDEDSQSSDRRDSRRVQIRIMIRDAALGGSFDERTGNLSLGGIYFAEKHPPPGTRVEIRFFLPGRSREVRAVGDILRVSREGGSFGAHVRFEELAVEDELAIARFLESAP